jgi:hypothetical protein
MPEMICDICKKTLHPLDAHMGYIDGKLVCVHIDCWNKYYAKEIEIEKARTC